MSVSSNAVRCGTLRSASKVVGVFSFLLLSQVTTTSLAWAKCETPEEQKTWGCVLNNFTAANKGIVNGYLEEASEAQKILLERAVYEDCDKFDSKDSKEKDKNQRAICQGISRALYGAGNCGDKKRALGNLLAPNKKLELAACECIRGTLDEIPVAVQGDSFWSGCEFLAGIKKERQSECAGKGANPDNGEVSKLKENVDEVALNKGLNNSSEIERGKALEAAFQYFEKAKCFNEEGIFRTVGNIEISNRLSSNYKFAVHAFSQGISLEKPQMGTVKCLETASAIKKMLATDPLFDPDTLEQLRVLSKSGDRLDDVEKNLIVSRMFDGNQNEEGKKILIRILRIFKKVTDNSAITKLDANKLSLALGLILAPKTKPLIKNEPLPVVQGDVRDGESPHDSDRAQMKAAVAKELGDDALDYGPLWALLLNAHEQIENAAHPVKSARKNSPPVVPPKPKLDAKRQSAQAAKVKARRTELQYRGPNPDQQIAEPPTAPAEGVISRPSDVRNYSFVPKAAYKLKIKTPKGDKENVSCESVTVSKGMLICEQLRGEPRRIPVQLLKKVYEKKRGE